MIRNGAFVGDLPRLRDGSLRFDTFVRRHQSYMEQWAGWIVRRRKARSVLTAVGLDDLAQLGFLACWRAVDDYDPTRKRGNGKPVSIEAHVAWEIGKRMEREVDYHAGWPRKDRSPVARPTSLDEMVDTRAKWAGHRGAEGMGTLLGEMGHVTAEETRVYTLGRVTNFQRDVELGGMGGLNPTDISRAIYGDVERRLDYRLNSLEHTVKRVRSALDAMRDD